MTRSLRRQVAFIALTLAALAMISPARSSEGNAASKNAKVAANALQEYGNDRRRAGLRADFAAPAVDGLLRVIFDSERLLALPEPTAQDLPWLMDWADAANRGYKQLFLFGLEPGKRIDQTLLARNMRDYEDQISVGMSFLIRIVAMEVNASALFMADLPKEQVTKIRIDGFRGLRKGAAECVQGALLAAAANDMKLQNARMLVAAVRDTRDTWANALYPEDRSQTMAVLKHIIAHVSDKEIVEGAADVLTALAKEN
ncbi:hypothetical protein RPMA_02250 [Tardiphaga alba]|uniref:HEAT repeat domain-containing protein n=1 Tax=Tardiphaga alba TaxID=340268 RepID=A0ABX8A6C5_9BRAD|nr:hypothetical protein [Tardiphaga alba]QUS37815.1 hypothetical protein RPMA_02250 [Tardiphaga alba]